MSFLEYQVKTVPTGIRKVLYMNWGLVLLLIAVASMGFLMLYSVAGGSLSPWAEPQIKRFVAGLVLMFIIAMVPIWFIRNMAGLAYAVSVLLLLGVEFFGAVGMGAQRWIDIGPLRLQPSELMKITLVMMLAAYYDWLDPRKTSRPLWVLIPVLLTVGPTALVLIQPNLGTALMLLMGGGVVMFAAGVSLWYFAVVIAAGGGAGFASVFYHVAAHRGSSCTITSIAGSTPFLTPRQIRSAQATTSSRRRSRSGRAAGRARGSCRERKAG
jgi:rod shape determining protein RodA